jgi:23S rRNA (cytosine1962-C5)-methyltransferase
VSRTDVPGSPPAARMARGKEKSLLRRHPWVFSGAVGEAPRRASFGDTVDLVSSDGEFLARAAWSPESQIRARVWTFDESEAVDDAFFARRIEAAVRARERLAADSGFRGNAMRLVHGESDGLPGLVVDRYGDVVVCQFLAAGVERWHAAIVAALASATGAASIYERSDADVRAKEGLPERTGLVHGVEPPALVEIEESGRRYLVDVREGHKTGFYLDQRFGRDAAVRWCAGREVLNAFAYSGGFSVAALAGGAARVTDVDTSAAALALARRNVEANLRGHGGERSAQNEGQNARASEAEGGRASESESGRASESESGRATDAESAGASGGTGGDDGATRYEAVEADVFALLRRYRDSRRSFDAIVLDPPKFVDARAHLDKGARGYKDINLLAFKLLRPGGVLLTFSCSGLVSTELFQKIVADAAVDARRDAVIVERLAQPPDHPVSLAFPEGAYLKGLVCRVR